MPYARMRRLFLRGLLWLYLLLEFGFTALSLEPGYLDFDNLPDTNFSCLGKVIGGYYADLETNCQMFHVCTIGQLDEPMDIRFLCLNGTVFDQETRVCERIDEVDCSKSEQFYGLNLELYGNTQPPILEDAPETEQPLAAKSTTTSPTTTSKPKANTPFYTSAKPPAVTTPPAAPHHFPVANSPDIRFNPEEINISLHPGAPPDIRTKPATYQQQSYSDNNKKVVVTTHSENSDNKKVSVTTHSEVLGSDDFGGERVQTQTPRTQKPHLHNFGQPGKSVHHSTPSDINYEFTFRQTEPNFPDFHTELPQSFFHSDFHSDQDYAGHHHNPQQFKSSTFHDDFISTTKGLSNFQQKVPTTVRNFLQSLKPPAPNQPHHYHHHQTEKPQRVQLPLPLLPTLPPLTFSSPAPFALQHHIDTKRYTKDHPAPPRIVVSASASVSDASGRRLNYSLGTIGAAEFLEQPPHSYDEYKDEDVGLDPFYHDVPKLKRSRTKRETLKHSDIIRNEEEAVNVLKFLFDWYKNNEKTASESTTLPTVVTTKEENFGKSQLFDKNSKFNIIGEGGKAKNVQERRSTDTMTKQQSKTTTGTTVKTTTTTQMSKYEKDFLDELFGHEEDYVNDNFEPVAYKQKYEEEGKKQNATTEVMSTEVVPMEQVKNPSLPKDYVDDNIEPIYFNDRVEPTKEVMTSSEAGAKAPLDEKTKEADDISPSANTHLNPNELKPSNNSSPNQKAEKEPPIGDTETNNIKQNTQKEKTSTETVLETVRFSEPKSEILEPVTTEKTTTTTMSAKPRNSQKRGRKRFHTTTEKEKEPEIKNVVLEKITERAHTAKDDFNYLRTLYKVYSTTPTYNSPETKSLEETGGMRTQKGNDYFDLKEASPSDKVLRTALGENSEDADQAAPPPSYLIPIITTEATTTTMTVEAITPSSTASSEITSNTSTTEETLPSSITSQMITSSSTTTSERTTSTTTTTEKVPSTTSQISTTAREISSSTTEQIIPPTVLSEDIAAPSQSSTTTSEKMPLSTTEQIIPPSALSEDIVSSSIATIETIAPPSTATVETIAPPSTTTVETIAPPSTTTVETVAPSSTPRDFSLPRSTTTTERSSSTTSETTLPSSTSTTEMSTPSRRDGRRRGRTRFGDDSSRSRSDQRHHRRRRPEENDASRSTTVKTDTVQKKSSYREVAIEENGSNINRNIIPYPITTEYSPPLLLSGGSTERTEFLTQLTLNYKKIFQDISQTSGPIPPQVLDISTLAVTETNENVTTKPLEQYSGGVESQDKLTTHELVLPRSTESPKPFSAAEEEIQTTTSPEIVTPFGLLKSESQVLQTEETSTAGKTVRETQPYNVEVKETVPTSVITEKMFTSELAPETTTPNPTSDEVINKVTDTTTEKLLEETIPVEFTTRTSSTTEGVSTQEKVVETTVETLQETKQVVSMDDRKDDTTLDETTASVHPEEMTFSSIRDGTSLIPKITEIFNFFTKESDIFGVPTTLLTTEQMVKSTEVPKSTIDDVPSTQTHPEENILVTNTETSRPSITEYYKEDGERTEYYPSTIFVVRTTEKAQNEEKLQEENLNKVSEENLEQTEVYPSTVLVIRTTESPKLSQHQEEEKLPTLHQLSSQNLQKLIEEIEESTRSVVATTSIPAMLSNQHPTVTTTENPNQDPYKDIKDVIATTERRNDLEELTSLFEYTTKSNFVATTPATIVLAPEGKTESSTVPSTTVSHASTTATVVTDPELMSTSQIERLMISERPLSTTPTPVTSVTSRRGSARRGSGRGGGNRNAEARRGASRHRFSTESFTKRPEGRGQTVEEEIINELSKGSTTESYRRRVRVRTNGGRGKESSTDAALQKSASPTQPERARQSLPTTPLSKDGGRRHFIFNCFGKEMDRFYPDPRDCRLFHYCTQGYNKNQLIDMKFVCDLNTYFDDVKLICSNRKPKRCV